MQDNLNKEPFLVGIDNGMGNSKIYYISKENDNVEEIKIDFEAIVTELKEHDADSLSIDSTPYTFSEGVIAAEKGHFTKEHEVHRLLLWKALHEVYKKTGAISFDVSMNCSLDSYKDKKGKGVREKMLEKTSVKIKDGLSDEVELTINRLEVSPEGLIGGLLANLDLKKEDVIFNDIGTMNFTLIQVSRGVPKYETSYATKDGMNKIYLGIAERGKNLELGSSAAVKIYLERTSNKEMEPVAAIDDIILNYLIETVYQDIDTKLKTLDINMFTKLVFLGGGSVFLRRFLETKYSERELIFLHDSYFANAKGLYLKGARLFGHEIPKLPKKQTKKKVIKKKATDK